MRIAIMGDIWWVIICSSVNVFSLMGGGTEADVGFPTCSGDTQPYTYDEYQWRLYDNIHQMAQGQSWTWSYGSWIYNYLCVTGMCLDMCRLVVAKQKARAQTDKVIELVDDGYKMRFRHIKVRSTGIRACGNKNRG